MCTDQKMDSQDTVELPIDGVLDLHTFRPSDVKDLLGDYITACLERNILRIRIIHGKGTGALRRTVHAVLGRHPSVSTFRLAGEDEGGWGATIAELIPAPRNSCQRQEDEKLGR